MRLEELALDAVERRVKAMKANAKAAKCFPFSEATPSMAPRRGQKGPPGPRSLAARATGPVSVGKALEARQGRDGRPWPPGSMRSTT